MKQNVNSCPSFFHNELTIIFAVKHVVVILTRPRTQLHTKLHACTPVILSWSFIQYTQQLRSIAKALHDIMLESRCHNTTYEFAEVVVIDSLV